MTVPLKPKSSEKAVPIRANPWSVPKGLSGRTKAAIEKRRQSRSQKQKPQQLYPSGIWGYLKYLFNIIFNKQFLYLCLILFMLSSIPLAEARRTDQEERVKQDEKRYIPPDKLSWNPTPQRYNVVPEYAFLPHMQTTSGQRRSPSRPSYQKIDILFSQASIRPSDKMAAILNNATNRSLAISLRKEAWLQLAGFLKKYHEPLDASVNSRDREIFKSLQRSYIEDYVAKIMSASRKSRRRLANEMILNFSGFAISAENLSANWFSRAVENYLGKHYPGVTLAQLMHDKPNAVMSWAYFTPPSILYLNARLIEAANDQHTTLDNLMEKIQLHHNLMPIVTYRIAQDLSGKSAVLTSVSLYPQSPAAKSWRSKLQQAYDEFRSNKKNSAKHAAFLKIAKLYAEVDDDEMARRCYAQAALLGSKQGLIHYLEQIRKLTKHIVTIIAAEYGSESRAQASLAGIKNLNVHYELVIKLYNSSSDEGITYLYAEAIFKLFPNLERVEKLKAIFANSEGAHKCHAAWFLAQIYAYSGYAETYDLARAQQALIASRPLYQYQLADITGKIPLIEIPETQPGSFWTLSRILFYMIPLASLTALLGYFFSGRSQNVQPIKAKEKTTAELAQEFIDKLNVIFSPLQFSLTSVSQPYYFTVLDEQYNFTYKGISFTTSKNNIFKALSECYPHLFIRKEIEKQLYFVTPEEMLAKLFHGLHKKDYVSYLYKSTSHYQQAILNSLNQLHTKITFSIDSNNNWKIEFDGANDYAINIAGKTYNLIELDIIKALKSIAFITNLKTINTHHNIYRFQIHLQSVPNNLMELLSSVFWPRSKEYAEAESKFMQSYMPDRPHHRKNRKRDPGIVRVKRRGQQRFAGEDGRKSRKKEEENGGSATKRKSPSSTSPKKMRLFAKHRTHSRSPAEIRADAKHFILATTVRNPLFESIILALQTFSWQKPIAARRRLFALVGRYLEIHAHHARSKDVTALRDAMVHASTRNISSQCLMQLQRLILMHTENKQLMTLDMVYKLIEYSRPISLDSLEAEVNNLAKAVDGWEIQGRINFIRDIVFQYCCQNELPKEKHYPKDFVLWFDKLCELRNRWAHYDLRAIDPTELKALVTSTIDQKDLINTELRHIISKPQKPINRARMSS